jgi:hypothetical protein
MYSGCDYPNKSCLCTFWPYHPYSILQFYSIIFYTCYCLFLLPSGQNWQFISFSNTIWHDLLLLILIKLKMDTPQNRRQIYLLDRLNWLVTQTVLLSSASQVDERLRSSLLQVLIKLSTRGAFLRGHPVPGRLHAL